MKIFDLIFGKNSSVKGKPDSSKASNSIEPMSKRNPEKIGRDLGLEFYLFTGGVTDDTLPFCKSKNGKYFHYLEILEWPYESWEGKNPRTTENTIFRHVGGYCNAGASKTKCHHYLMAVSEAIVPKDDLLRAIQLGYYKPSASTRQMLGL
jgi:hypothetical protein